MLLFTTLLSRCHPCQGKFLQYFKFKIVPQNACFHFSPWSIQAVVLYVEVQRTLQSLKWWNEWLNVEAKQSNQKGRKLVDWKTKTFQSWSSCKLYLHSRRIVLNVGIVKLWRFSVTRKTFFSFCNGPAPPSDAESIFGPSFDNSTHQYIGQSQTTNVLQQMHTHRVDCKTYCVIWIWQHRGRRKKAVYLLLCGTCTPHYQPVTVHLLLRICI